MIQIIDKNRAKLVVESGLGSKRKRRTKTVTYSGKRDLERQYREFEDKVKNELPLSDITVTELLSSYIKSRKMLGMKATTEHGYKAAQNRLDERFGRVLAKDLTSYQLEEFVLDMSEKYAPKTIANTIFPLNAAYERAVRMGQLADNPCTRVSLPKKSKREIKTLSREDLVKFMSALENERIDFRVGYELCLMCGLRRSEVLGLRESDVNLLFRSVNVNKTRHIVEKKEYVQETKTARSQRTLAIPQKVADDIEELIRIHHSQPFNHSDYLIQDGFGKPLHPATFSDHINYVEDKAGIKRVSVHGLRHTFATLLNAEGVDIAQISAELGHSTITTTLNTYTHVFGDTTASSRGIAEKMDKTFGTFSALPEDTNAANA